MDLPTNPNSKAPEVKKKIQEEIIASDTSGIQKRMQELGNEYMIVAERMVKDWKTVAQIQAQMQFCIETLKARGITVEDPTQNSD